MQAVTRVNAEQASKRRNAGVGTTEKRGRLSSLVKPSDERTQWARRGIGDGMHVQEDHAQHGKPHLVMACDHQPELREEQAGPCGVAERLVVPMKPGNAGRGKGPQFKVSAGSSAGPGDWR